MAVILNLSARQAFTAVPFMAVILNLSARQTFAAVPLMAVILNLSARQTFTAVPFMEPNHAYEFHFIFSCESLFNLDPIYVPCLLASITAHMLAKS